MEFTDIFIAGAIGFVVSGFISVIKRWVQVSQWWNYVIAFFATFLAMIGLDFVQNGFGGWEIDFVGQFGVAFTATTMMYGLVIKKLGWDERLEGQSE